MRRRERKEAHLYLNVNAYTENALMTHKGVDLVSMQRSPCFSFKVAKSASHLEAVAIVAEQMGYPVDSIRLWPFLKRNNHANARPGHCQNCGHLLRLRKRRLGFCGNGAAKCARSTAAHLGDWWSVLFTLNYVFLLTKPFRSVHVLIFFKYYDIENSFLIYCGLEHVERQAKVVDLFELMWEKAGLQLGTLLNVYEEKNNCVHPMIVDFETTLEMAVDELMDGNIIVFERIDVTPPSDGPSGLLEYYQDLLHCVEVLFCDKNVPNDPGFSLELSMEMTYNQIATAVEMHLNADPLKLQFFKKKNNYHNIPGEPLLSNYDGTLKEILLHYKPRQGKKIYFQHVSD